MLTFIKGYPYRDHSCSSMNNWFILFFLGWSWKLFAVLFPIILFYILWKVFWYQKPWSVAFMGVWYCVNLLTEFAARNPQMLPEFSSKHNAKMLGRKCRKTAWHGWGGEDVGSNWYKQRRRNDTWRPDSSLFLLQQCPWSIIFSSCFICLCLSC